MVDFVKYIYMFGLSVWNGIIQLGNYFTFTDGSHITTMRELFIYIGQSWAVITDINPFYQPLVDMFGSTWTLDFIQLMSTLLTIPSVIISTTFSIFSGIFNYFGLSFAIPNFAILIIYIIISLGLPYIVYHFIAKLCRMAKDIINITN